MSGWPGTFGRSLDGEGRRGHQHHSARKAQGGGEPAPRTGQRRAGPGGCGRACRVSTAHGQAADGARPPRLAAEPGSSDVRPPSPGPACYAEGREGPPLGTPTLSQQALTAGAPNSRGQGTPDPVSSPPPHTMEG